jgi:DegV family protein with EDD domain
LRNANKISRKGWYDSAVAGHTGTTDMALRIITDCGADLPPEIVEKYGVEVIPMSVYLDEDEYVDGVTVTPKEVFDRMRGGAKARTTQIMPQVFVEFFEKYAQRGDVLIYIGFSGGLSGTFNSANVAKNELSETYPDFDLTVIDTKCASLGCGMVVYKALAMLEQGASKEEITEAAVFHAKHMAHIFTVDDLEYLYRGGRVSRTSAFVGGLLGIKPVLNVDDEGKLVPAAKVKGRANAIKKVSEMVCRSGFRLDRQIIGISHGDDMAAVTQLQNLLREAAGCEQFLVSYVGGTIGAHAGPGTLAVFFLDCDSPYEKVL